MTESRGAPASSLSFLLIVSGTVIGIAGTDLVLPAVPALPAALGGTPALAQLVLAAFVAGTAVGLLLFGELGARFDQRRLLAGSLVLYGLVSAAALLVSGLEVLVALRFLQGAAGSAAAVFAPGMLRALYGDGAVRAMGLLGSIEGIVPALAPLAGVWLLDRFGWQASFAVIAGLALLLAIAVAGTGRALPCPAAMRDGGGYRRLLRDWGFLRHALSQAFTLGGLLVFVFGAPAVMTGPLGGSLADFVAMQVTGIAFFVVGANLSGRLAGRFGVEPTILGGTALAAAGAVAVFVYALGGGTRTAIIMALFVPLNLGLGFRGPPGFMKAVHAARGDDARGAALVVLAILLTAAGGTAVAAPFITRGLVPLAGLAALICSAALGCLLVPQPRTKPA
jgi:MFS family permease